MQFDDYSFIGSGDIYIASKDPVTGDPLDYDFLGEVTALNIQYTQNQVERRSMRKPGRPVDKRAIISTDASLSMTTQSLDRRILRLLFSGEEFSETGATVSNEALNLNLTDAKWSNGFEAVYLSTKFTNLDLTTAPVLKYGPNLGAATTVVPAAQYTINDSGGINITKAFIDTISGTPANAAAWVIDYVYKDTPDGLSVGSRVRKCSENKYIRIEGTNLSECGTGEKQLIELYNVGLVSDTDLNLVSDDYTEVQFSGSVLEDPTRPLPATGTPDVWGQYFRIRRYGHN